MCTICVEYYNCSNPTKCIASYNVVQCLEMSRGEDCGQNKPGVDYSDGGYLRIETYAVGLCENGHRERGR